MNRIIPLIILLLAGCAPEVTHTTRYVLDTSPQGATIVCNGQDLGYTPTLINRRNNIDSIGENRAFTEEDAVKKIETRKLLTGELKVGENKYSTDRETIISIEIAKIVKGELGIGETTILNDEEVTHVIEAIKIVDGELTLGEYTSAFDEESLKETMEFVKIIKGAYSPICSAHWSSGVSKEYPLNLPYIYVGNGIFVYTLQRPEGAGYAQDAEFALKVQQLKQNQQNADRDAAIALRAVQAQESAALANVIKESTSAIQTIQNIKSIDSNKATTTCFTNLGITTCY